MSKLQEEIKFHGKTFPDSTHILMDRNGKMVIAANDASLFDSLAEECGLMNVYINFVITSPDNTVKYYIK